MREFTLKLLIAFLWYPITTNPIYYDLPRCIGVWSTQKCQALWVKKNSQVKGRFDEALSLFASCSNILVCQVFGTNSSNLQCLGMNVLNYMTKILEIGKWWESLIVVR